MKVLLSHLEQYLAKKPNWQDIFNSLTQAGIEIESLTPIGTPHQASGLGADDTLVELKITPNRGDCLSISGLLREIDALTGLEYTMPSGNVTNNASYATEPLRVNIEQQHACPVYSNMLIRGVNNTQVLPQFIVTRLEQSGLGSVSPVVDITNYVMLELGQPLHAFDAHKTGTSFTLRMAQAGEQIELLNQQNIDLTTDTLLVCDSSNKPVAIAGVMGGIASAVNADTREVIIESAYFVPEVIAAKAKQYGVVSNAAYRFERGVDFKLSHVALAKAGELITQYLGGEIVALNNTTINSCLPVLAKIVVNYSALNKFLGLEIAVSDINSILTRLGFVLDEVTPQQITCTPPSYRFDIQLVEDVYEEVARVYGYDKIPAQLPCVDYTLAAINPFYTQANLVKNCLVSRGYYEVVNYAFLEAESATRFNDKSIQPIALQNSIAGLTHLRTNLFAGLVKTMQYNVNRGANSLRLFELARVFHGVDAHQQPLKLAGLCYGKKNQFNWYDGGELVDFFDVKGDVEVLLAGIAQLTWVKCDDNPVLHAGRCAKIYVAEKHIGTVGQLHPRIAQELELDLSPYLFELNIEDIFAHISDFKLAKLSKFQKVTRDLAFIMDVDLPVATVVDYIHKLNIEVLKQVQVFDLYIGDKIPVQKKSVAFKLIFQAHKTLTDIDINGYLEQIIHKASESFNIKLR